MSNLNEFKAESELGSPLTFLNASAGTGKTYSICKKLCYLFVDSNEENRIKPEEAAVITFTNNAAKELKTRIQTFLTNEKEVADLKKSFGKSLNKEQFEKNRAYAIAHLNEASIGTIHHFCTEILGIVGTLANFDAGRTLSPDTSDLLEFTNNANLTKYSQSKSFAHSFNGDYYQNTLKNAQSSFNRDMFFADLKDVLKSKKDKSSIESDSAEDEAKCTSIQPNSELLAWQRWAKDIAQLYGLLERTHSVMSNDSLLALTNEAVSSEPVVKLLQKRWKLVMVDEFQDTDINQWNIIKKAFLSDSNENSPVKVITVGDDKQSIYSFRGADVENFSSAREEAQKDNNKMYVLNINYRSDSCVVDTVNAITNELFDPKSVVDVRAHITNRRLLGGNHNSSSKGLFIRTAETKFNIKDAERYQMPIPFTFPTRLANLKRGFSVIYSDIENSDKKLVIINAHLDAYDKDNKGKIAQTKQLVEFMEKEYAKGNYVLVGADFNQELRDLTKEEIEKTPAELWRAELFDKTLLKDKFKLYYDNSRPSARLNNKPYEKGSNGTYEFIIDGFIASDNIEVSQVKTLDQDYKYSDHNPVKLRFRLK